LGTTHRICCRIDIEALADSQSELKKSFQANLEAVEFAMNDVVELQQSYSKIAELQSEQSELKSTVESLSRQLKQREEELSSLSTQLREVRSCKESCSRN
jgi:septal ring factor EnvC (AmiA/AmiB activator)